MRSTVKSLNKVNQGLLKTDRPNFSKTSSVFNMTTTFNNNNNVNNNNNDGMTRNMPF